MGAVAGMGAAVLRPYVAQHTYWMLLHHGVFQGYYFFDKIGRDRNARERYRGHPAFDMTERFCNEFDRMNAGGDTHASEASLKANPDGSKLYGVWAQWVFDDLGEEIAESEAMARRVWWIDDYISPDNSWTLPGTNQP